MVSGEKTPLLDHALGEASAFRPEKLLEAVRNGRGATEAAIPRVCLLDFVALFLGQNQHAACGRITTTNCAPAWSVERVAGTV